MENNNCPGTLVIPLRWKPVVLRDGRRFDWHRNKPRAAADTEQLEVACVYRWVLRGADGHPYRFYIGESARFGRRLSEYRSASPAVDSTEGRLREEISRCEEQGGMVDLEFLDLETPLSVNGKIVNKHSLGEQDVRQMMEGIAKVTTKAEGIELINQIGENSYDATIRTILRKIVAKNGRDEAMRLLTNLLQSSDEGT